MKNELKENKSEELIKALQIEGYRRACDMVRSEIHDIKTVLCDIGFKNAEIAYYKYGATLSLKFDYVSLTAFLSEKSIELFDIYDLKLELPNAKSVHSDIRFKRGKGLYAEEPLEEEVKALESYLERHITAFEQTLVERFKADFDYMTSRAFAVERLDNGDYDVNNNIEDIERGGLLKTTKQTTQEV